MLHPLSRRSCASHVTDPCLGGQTGVHPVADSPLSDAEASALYNMALAGTPQKVNLRSHPLLGVDTADSPTKPLTRMRRGQGWSENGRAPTWSYPLIALSVDKLRLGVFVNLELEALHPRIFGCKDHGIRKGRKRGDFQTVKAWAVSGGGDDGTVYWELLDDGRGAASKRLICEFNPSKVGDLDRVAVTLHALRLGSLRGVWVDRFDAAFDYAGPRRAFVLDDRLRLADHFGCGPWGPQTERTGFRRGSKLKAQLYDKTAERQAAGESDVRADVTRFELQLLKPDREPKPLYDPPGLDETLPLVELPDVAWPGGAITVRVLPRNPLAVSDPVYAGFLSIVRGPGVRCALNWMKHVLGVRYRTLQTWLEWGAPEHDPSPRSVWDAEWRGVAQTCVDRLVSSMADPFGFSRQSQH